MTLRDHARVVRIVFDTAMEVPGLDKLGFKIDDSDPDRPGRLVVTLRRGTRTVRIAFGAHEQLWTHDVRDRIHAAARKHLDAPTPTRKSS